MKHTFHHFNTKPQNNLNIPCRATKIELNFATQITLPLTGNKTDYSQINECEPSYIAVNPQPPLR